MHLQGKDLNKNIQHVKKTYFDDLTPQSNHQFNKGNVEIISSDHLLKNYVLKPVSEQKLIIYNFIFYKKVTCRYI